MRGDKTFAAGDRPVFLWAFLARDCHLATASIAATAKREQTFPDPRIPDPAPLIIDHDFKL